MELPLEGGCACGEVRYRLTATPLIVHACHYTECQRQSGTAFATNALIESAHVDVVKGRPIEANLPTESGRPHPAIRCGACGITLWSHYGGRRAISFIRVGTLDDARGVAPDVHIFTRSKVPWLRLPEGALAFEVFYDMDKVWRPESLVRRKAALA
ncbi:MAG TPA: GFA family protein [Caulobacteraceae bacterium]|nr:GFA family protein [Caulobacteraceae bacterium]